MNLVSMKKSTFNYDPGSTFDRDDDRESDLILDKELEKKITSTKEIYVK